MEKQEEEKMERKKTWEHHLNYIADSKDDDYDINDNNKEHTGSDDEDQSSYNANNIIVKDVKESKQRKEKEIQMVTCLFFKDMVSYHQNYQF